MKIKFNHYEDDDYYEFHHITVTNDDETEIKAEEFISPLCECPEDAIIGRDLKSGYDFLRFIQLGFDAAKNGETLTIIETENKERG
jgi:hypothetical protein